MNYEISPERAGKIATELLRWYDGNKRDLPMRHTRDPYCIWVSEIMAQQTRIAFLLSYYQRFIALFPTVEALAAADEAEVLKAWEGLGYYSRARNLHKAAKQVVEQYNGQIPRTVAELRTLPGIGEYTAGAILSIAYGIPVPAVDGNVLRVFARVEGSRLDIAQVPTRQVAGGFVEKLMPMKRAGCFTQALMELGALICTPKSPDCENCPVSALCKANQEGLQAVLPVKSAKKAPKIEEKTVLVLRNDRGQILMRRRTETLLNGLWELYLVKGRLDQEAVKAHLATLGHTCVEMTEMGQAKHVFTHVIWQMEGYDCRSDSSALPDGYRWVDEEEIASLALPVALKYYFKQI